MARRNKKKYERVKVKKAKLAKTRKSKEEKQNEDKTTRVYFYKGNKLKNKFCKKSELSKVIAR